MKAQGKKKKKAKYAYLLVIIIQVGRVEHERRVADFFYHRIKLWKKKKNENKIK